MDPNQAISVLIQAAYDGQAKGAYTLQQATVIAKAIETLTTPPVQEEPITNGPLADKVVREKK